MGNQAGGQTENPAGGASGVFGSAYGGCGYGRRVNLATTTPRLRSRTFYGERIATRAKGARCDADLGTLPVWRFQSKCLGSRIRLRRR
jgi:hypothetical protein